MNLFGMVTTWHSRAYTPHALRSFFENTRLGPDDRFYVIDNDATRTPYPEPLDPRVTLIRNPQPVCFSANVNQVMRIARECRADLFFLNNDLIFPPHWLPPLLVPGDALLSPVSNFQCPYRTRHWTCGQFLDLEDYLGHEDEFVALAREHQTSVTGYRSVLKVPFFCIKIPYAVQVAVGDLEEQLRAGAEDDDYTLRCHRAGFPVVLALGSYVLHFQGKSTWRGAETPEQRRHREQAFLSAFRAKWGQRLLDIMVLGKVEPVQANPCWWYEWNHGHYGWVIEQLLHADRPDLVATSGPACLPLNAAAYSYGL